MLIEWAKALYERIAQFEAENLELRKPLLVAVEEYDQDKKIEKFLKNGQN